MTTSETLFNLLTTLAIPLGSAFLATGLILRAQGVARLKIQKDIAGIQKKVEEQGRTLEALIAGQAAFATQASLDEVLRSQQRNAIDALLLAGHAFVDQRRQQGHSSGEQREG
jgi:hypothetical protein